MQVRRVPARTGWRWVTEGFTILAASPMPLIATGVLMMFTLLVVSAVPVLGTFLPLVLSPALSFGYLQAIRRVQEGKPPSPWILFLGLKPPGSPTARSLLALGVINARATAIALMITAAIDEGAWLGLLTTSGDGATLPAPSTPPSPAAAAGAVYAGFVFLVLYAPMQVALWYAPLFAGLHHTTAVKALVFSAVAVWRNKGAFAIYFAGWFAVAVGLSVLIQVLLAVVPAGFSALVLAPAFLLLMAALYCSFWPTYRDTVDPIAADPAS
jgi:hypothetical protein